MKKIISVLMKAITKAKLAGKPKLFIQNLQQQLDKIIRDESKDKRKN